MAHETLVSSAHTDVTTGGKTTVVFSDANFQADVIDSNAIAVVDLWAEWCGPCRMMTPIIDELSSEYAGRAVIGKLNVDENPVTPTNYGVRGIPTFLIFKGGVLQDKVVGAQTKKALQDKIEALLDKKPSVAAA
jgi:thioredoxin 1